MQMMTQPVLWLLKDHLCLAIMLSARGVVIKLVAAVSASLEMIACTEPDG